MKTVSAVIMSALVACACRAGTIQINSLDVEADRAVSVTGAQSNKIESAAAHTNRADNPHAVTLAQAAAAGGFAGTETLSPESVLIAAFDGYTSLSSFGFNTRSQDFTVMHSIDIDSGLTLNFLQDTYVWQINGSTLDYIENTFQSHWSFARTNGFYTVAATSDLAPKLDSSGGTATNLAVQGTLTLNGESITDWPTAADTCPVWQSAGLLPTAGDTQYPTFSRMSITLANTATNLWLVMQHPAPRSHIVMQLQTFGNSVAVSTNPVSVAVKTGGYGDLADGSPTVRTVICDGSEASGRYTNIVYIAPSATPTYGGAFLRFDLTRPNTMASGNGVNFVIPFWRCATSNEILTKTFAP